MWVPSKSFLARAWSEADKVRSHARVAGTSTHWNSERPGLCATSAATTFAQAQSTRHNSSSGATSNNEKVPSSSSMLPLESTCHASVWILLKRVAEIPLVGSFELPWHKSLSASTTTCSMPHSRTKRKVCQMAHSWGSRQHSVSKWRCALHPAESARSPLTAPARKLWKWLAPMVVPAMAWRPFGQAACLIALIFCLYGLAERRSLGHKSFNEQTRSTWVAFVCCLVIWTWAPKDLQLFTVEKPCSLREVRPAAVVDQVKVLRGSIRRSMASVNSVIHLYVSVMLAGLVVRTCQSST